MGADRRCVVGTTIRRILVRLLILALVWVVFQVGEAKPAQAGLQWQIFLPLVSNGSSPAASQAMPPTDTSYYVTTTDPSVAYNLGCSQGLSDASASPPANSLVVLDFGGQLSDGSGSLLVNGLAITSAQIEAVAEAFAHGYWYCTGSDLSSVLSLAIGTNNSYDDVSAAGGSSWAQVVAAVAADDQAAGYSTQVIVAGADDIEPAWDSAASSEAWVNGYASFSPATFYVDYGSADGCPTDNASGVACDNGWTQQDVWYVSWGATPARALPEIYASSNASQWTMIALYGADSLGSGGKILFSGPLDTYPLWSESNTAQQAWQEFSTALNSYPATAQRMPYSVEIRNET